MVSNKVSFGKKDFKYFVELKDAKKNMPLCIFLPKMSTYIRNFDKTKCMSFLIKDGKWFKNVMKFRKISATLSKNN